MPTTLKIKITKEILQDSCECSSYDRITSCAIALAIRDIFPFARVGQTTTIYRVDKMLGITDLSQLRSVLPSEAVEFIKRFDDSTPAERLRMDELEFEIEVPDAIIDSIDIEEVKRKLINHPTLEFVNTTL